jgi:hypothetical protein
MAYFRADLELDGHSYPLQAFDLIVHRPLDVLGRPASGSPGSQLAVWLLSTEEDLLPDWMTHPTKQLNGKITVIPVEGKSREISFEEGCCVELIESYDATGGNLLMNTKVVISAKTLKVGSVAFTNDWI